MSGRFRPAGIWRCAGRPLRDDYAITPGKPFHRYGIEQQACIVEHAFRARARNDAETLARLAPILPFPGWG